MDSLLLKVLNIAKIAGKLIMQYYERTADKKIKADGSPITAADLAAHNFIKQALKEISPTFPILSEETEEPIAYKIRQKWDHYWLIDPLDGTQEFLEKNGEFTINIALIAHHRPILGVITAPALNLAYIAKRGEGAFKEAFDNIYIPLKTRAIKRDNLNILVSRRHAKHSFQFSPTINEKIHLIKCGSSLKFAWLAEGKADVYPRFGPTSEWDTAAGQCILEESGGTVIEAASGNILTYNKKLSLINPHFVALSDGEFDWRTLGLLFNKP